MERQDRPDRSDRPERDGARPEKKEPQAAAD
jgi:hypothetical protein